MLILNGMNEIRIRLFMNFNLFVIDASLRYELYDIIFD